MDGKRYILASGSPRRRELLRELMETFETIPSHVQEDIIAGLGPDQLCRELALRKAREVSSSFPDAVVIGADTVVVLRDRVLGKPHDLYSATRMLESLSGRTHMVITGVAVVNQSHGVQLVDSETSEVSFRVLGPEVIEDYVNRFKPLDKAGAYGIQEVKNLFLDHLKGNYDNVVGLPIGLLREMLHEARKSMD